MTDPEIEELLRRYRPAGPAPDVRARIVAGNQVTGRAWPWAAAAAVLLASVCVLHVATRNVYEGVRGNFSSVATKEDFPALDAAIGDDEALKQQLEIVRRIESETRSPAPMTSPESWQ